MRPAQSQRQVKEGAINALHLGPCNRLGAGSGIILAAALAFAGCASGPAHPPAPLTVSAPDVPYTIGPLDTLNIVVWRNPDVSSTVSVRPDGFISAPLVPDTPAAGRTPGDLSRRS